MKRKIISQMRNEWRSNVWMTVELVIVGVVLFGIFGYFATFAYMHRPPKGVDFTDIYVGRLGIISDNSSSYKAYNDSVHNVYTDLEMLKANLTGNPYVESVGVGNNAIPYNYNYYGWMITKADSDSAVVCYGNMRYMGPEMIKTLRLQGYDGERPEELAAMVEEGKILISVPETGIKQFKPDKWKGHGVFFGRDSDNIIEVGALINPIRRVDYEPLYGGIVLVSQAPREYFPREIAMRIKPGTDNEFVESLDESYLEFGNVFVSDVRSLERIKKEAHRQFTITMRNLSTCTAFLMIAVFLGILGSFWYRTQQRIPEIALRKVNGATGANVLRRCLSEGLMLLLFATPIIAIIIAIILSRIDLEEMVPTPLWLIWLMLPVTVAALAIMIVAGIAFPAIKAMKINPAEALKDQ